MYSLVSSLNKELTSLEDHLWMVKTACMCLILKIICGTIIFAHFLRPSFAAKRRAREEAQNVKKMKKQT